MRWLIPLLFLGTTWAQNAEIALPEALEPVPSARQLSWQERELSAFIHFSINTFTDKEWGYGDEDPALFDPTDFDAEQIVSTLAEAGFERLILTCKHHDGFCLWPTETTDHNISASPFRDGEGDLVAEFSEACAAHGLGFGVYVSPWDRNNALYGTPEYVTQVFRPQIEELLSNYGNIVEVWFDGANGGDGYYGGANEERKIDRTTYYDWETTWNMVRELAPDAVIFSDVGPDVRWIGNERGHSPKNYYNTFTPIPWEEETITAPGWIDTSNSGTGTPDGKFWIPGEVDVSIRPGWFWHEAENDQVRSAKNLMDIYLDSVGHGTVLLLNVPPERTGQLHDHDVQSLRQFGQHLGETFEENLALDWKLGLSPVADDLEPNSSAAVAGIEAFLDEDPWSAVTVDDSVREAEFQFNYEQPRTFNLIRLREDIRLGQRIRGIAIDVLEDDDNHWREIASAETVGASRLWRVPQVTTNSVRIRVTDAAASPALSDYGLYLEPSLEE